MPEKAQRTELLGVNRQNTGFMGLLAAKRG